MQQIQITNDRLFYITIVMRLNAKTIEELNKMDVRPNDLKQVLEKGLHHQHIIHMEY